MTSPPKKVLVRGLYPLAWWLLAGYFAFWRHDLTSGVCALIVCKLVLEREKARLRKVSR